MIRVLICDDQWIVCEGLEAILESDPEIEVVGTTHDGSEAIEAISETQPDVVLMDLKMPGMNGIQATRCTNDLLLCGKGTMLTPSLQDRPLIA